ncbi:MAG: methylated-DNA--[protein]-cysteine S-methyltransferase [Clostridia bacterium]|nr:methylated-DNA--[protein]-cysteine S-methyltransferase [Clostridia bacterium]
MEHSVWMETPFGTVTLTETDGFLTGLDFGAHGVPDGAATPLLTEAMRQLGEYFAGERKAFDLPLKPSGPAFRMRVLEALQQVPYGTAVSYGTLAAMAGSPGAARAVGQAVHNNPIAIAIPCHRVLGASGKLTGFGGGLPAKRFLLELEGIPYRE